MRHKTERIKKSFQIWFDEDLKAQFKALVDLYDPMMPMSTAIIKLVQQAIKENYLPGYIRKTEMTTTVNKLAESIIKPKNTP